MNKSCDACSNKKRKCNGGDPCSRCVRRGDGHLCKYSRRRPYTSNNKRFRAWRSSTEQKEVNATLKARTKPHHDESSTDAHGIGRDKREMRCVEAPHQLSPDALSKPPPATKNVGLSTTDYDAHARLARVQREAAELIASTNTRPVRAKNDFYEGVVSDSKSKAAVECQDTELKASVEKCIIPTVHGLLESQTVSSAAFPVVKQSTIRATVEMDIAKGGVPTFNDIVIDFDSPTHSQSNEYVASIIPPSHAGTLSLRELEDPISAEDWLEIAAEW